MKHKKLFAAVLLIWTTRSVFANPIVVVEYSSLYGLSEIGVPLFVAPTGLLIE